MSGDRLFRRPTGRIAGSQGEEIAALPPGCIWTSRKLRAIEAAWAAQQPRRTLTSADVDRVLAQLVADNGRKP
jgi:hypothetical protein